MRDEKTSGRNRQPRGRAADAEAAFTGLLTEASSRGFYGVVSLTLRVQDGCIQHVSVATERVIR